MEQVLYGPTTCMFGAPPYVKCFHVLYDLWSPIPYMEIGIVWSPHVYIWSPLSYMEQILYGPPTCMFGRPTREVSSCII